MIKFCYQTAPELSLLCFVRSDWEKMAPKFSSITPEQMISLRRSAKVAIVDVRDDERSFLHIAGSHHYSSKSFCERIPNLVAAVRDDECVVFHCTLSEVRGPACAQMFIDYLSNMNEDSGIKEVMILEGGFSAWLAPGRPICRCTDSPCKAQSA